MGILRSMHPLVCPSAAMSRVSHHWMASISQSCRSSRIHVTCPSSVFSAGVFRSRLVSGLNTLSASIVSTTFKAIPPSSRYFFSADGFNTSVSSKTLLRPMAPDQVRYYEQRQPIILSPVISEIWNIGCNAHCIALFIFSKSCNLATQFILVFKES